MTAMINASLHEGCLPSEDRRAIVTSLLKKPELNADELKKLSTCVQPDICV